MMTEKRFFHLALQNKLLSGEQLKRKLDATLKTESAPAAAKTSADEKRTGALYRWIGIPAAAVLLVLTVAVGTVAVTHSLREHAETVQPGSDVSAGANSPSATGRGGEMPPDTAHVNRQTPEVLHTPQSSSEPTQPPTALPMVYEDNAEPLGGFRNMELFTCDWDGDGETETIRIAVDQHLAAVTDGKRTSSPVYTHDLEASGVKRAILLDLDPESPYWNLILVIPVENGQCYTYAMHPEGDTIVITNELCADCIWDDTSLVLWEETDYLGEGTGYRRYHGDVLTPDSDWLVSENAHGMQLNHISWLRVIQDIPCTVDGQPSVIKAGTRLYRTRFNSKTGVVEVCTEDGTIAQIAFDSTDSFLIDSIRQEEYFEYLPLGN